MRRCSGLTWCLVMLVGCGGERSAGDLLDLMDELRELDLETELEEARSDWVGLWDVTWMDLGGVIDFPEVDETSVGRHRSSCLQLELDPSGEATLWSVETDWSRLDRDGDGWDFAGGDIDGSVADGDTGFVWVTDGVQLGVVDPDSDWFRFQCTLEEDVLDCSGTGPRLTAARVANREGKVCPGSR